jgi:gliding motility associated protien GldN
MKYRSFISILFLFVLSGRLAAQEVIKTSSTPVQSSPVSSGVLSPPQDYPWTKEDAKAKRQYAYNPIREADAMWAKRVWRVIDLREKMNMPLYYPVVPTYDRKSLFDVITKGIRDGELTVYDNPLLDDEFTQPLFKEQAMAKLVHIDTLDIEQLDGTWIKKVDTVTVTSESIKQYWIKEDWYFDKQRGTMEARIIGICPLKENIDPATGDVRGYQPLFWVYFPSIRKMMASQDVLVRQNNSDRMTFDEIFSKRFFSSYIRKESNVYDRSISEYRSGLDALLEAENIKDNIFMMEHDMWHF